jgi:hypothetical protein
MSNWKESLDKDLQSREVEIQTILDRFQVERKLTEIRDQIWVGKGQVHGHRIEGSPFPIGFRLVYGWNRYDTLAISDGYGWTGFKTSHSYSNTSIIIDLTDEPETSFYFNPMRTSTCYTFWMNQHLGMGKLFLRVADDTVLLGHKPYVLLDPDSPQSEKEFDNTLKLSNLRRTQFGKLPDLMEKR